MTRGALFVNGQWREAAGAAFASLDPASGATVWDGAGASEADVAAAVAAAVAAFPAWARLPLAERIDHLARFKAVLAARGDALAELIARETGKPLWEAKGEAGAMAGKVDISIAAYHERTGETTNPAAFGRAELRHKPHGALGVLGPYNFPGHLPNGHIVPALLAGNTIVFKPSEITPAVGAAMVEAWAEAGLPDGVLNLVQGGREAGAALLDDDRLAGVLFTGSVDTGVMIHRKFAGRPDKILALEMGGNNPLIVWDAADAEAAATIALHSAFLTSGQRCSCARRLIVADGAAGEAAVAALVALMARVRVDVWNAEPEPFMGPLVSAAAAERVLAAQESLIEAGAAPLRACATLPRGAAFLSPGLVDMTPVIGAAPDARFDKEVFGPLLQLVRVPSFERALEVANATAFGLSAGLISDDAALWQRFGVEIRAGIVNWNRPTTGAASNMPFGGPGFSGNHRPSAYYAADYCAYPVASQIAEAPERLATKGLG